MGLGVEHSYRKLPSCAPTDAVQGRTYYALEQLLSSSAGGHGFFEQGHRHRRSCNIPISREAFDAVLDACNL